MDPAVRKLIDQPWPHLKRYQEIGALLPEDDAELDRWLAEVVEAMDQIGFTTLCTAALGANRKVDSRHLERGAGLMNHWLLMACFAWHMQGDVVEHLLVATSDDRLPPGARGIALFMLALICEERRDKVFPPELITRTRLVCRRRANMHQFGIAALYGVAKITKDEGIAAIMEIDSDFKWKQAESMCQSLKKVCTGPVFDLIVTDRHPQLGLGSTMRRSVPRIGRNELCPCKSGKKYKNCCMARDAERLDDSSHIAGKSQADLRAEPEPHLTLQQLRRALPHEFLRYDPLKIAPELLEDFFIGLFAHSLYDRAIECLELLGFPEEWDEIASDFLFIAMTARRIEPIKKLLAVHPRSAKLQEQLSYGIELAMVEDDPARFLEELEKGALQVLRSDEEGFLQDYAFGWICSKLPATGIFIARAAIYSMEDDEFAHRIVDQIELARDKLGLPPDDPAGDVLEKRMLDATRADSDQDSKESRALAETRERLDAKAREVASLRESLETLRKDVHSRESRPKPETVVSAAQKASDASDERVLQELRFKVQKLKGELKDRHEERVALRQELREARAKIESSAESSSAVAEEVDTEEEHVLPAEAAAVQPIRIPEYPKKFRDELERVPRHVARNALATIGRLAGGELAAFSGVVRLKACADVYRQRIGIDHRLLFRLTSDRLIVVDLINRRDLLRRIKSLMAGG
jgi:hypothetical protein